MTGAMKPDSDIVAHQREAIVWMLRLKPGIATTEDVAAFRLWCGQSPAHARAFAQARELWQALGPAGQRMFDPNAVNSFAARDAVARVRLGRRAFLTGTVAASAALAIYAAVYPPLHLWPSIAELNADYRTATGEQRQIALADDIAVDMNTQTSIGLRPGAEDADRIELIAGESTFRTQSRALEVVAGIGRARGTNAQFNVRRDGDKVSVTCLDGQVTVECQAASVTLASQSQVFYSPAGLASVFQTDTAVVTSWHEGFLVFHDTRLVDVVAEINRYRRGMIVVVGEALAERPVNGRFYLARLDEVVEKFRNAFGAHITTLPGGVVILS
jgi:transmembrane sensor